MSSSSSSASSSTSSPSSHPLIYFEEQSSSLCAVHALNNFFQSPTFTEVDLGEIAHQVDEEERNLFLSGGNDSRDLLTFLASDSENSDNSGNFSIEVINKALSAFEFTTQNILSPKLRDSPYLLEEMGYLCNYKSHWLSLRRMYDTWINLNSLLDKGPEVLSNTYVGMYLKQLQREGYSIFVIRPIGHEEGEEGKGKEKGNNNNNNNNNSNKSKDNEKKDFPTPPPPMVFATLDVEDTRRAYPKRFFTLDSIINKSKQKDNKKSNNNNNNVNSRNNHNGHNSQSHTPSVEEEQFNRAIAESLKQSTSPSHSPSPSPSLPSNRSPSSSSSCSSNSSSSSHSAISVDSDGDSIMEEDEELRRAIELSMQK